MHWEDVSNEILDYESKLLQIKISFFHVLHGWHEFSFPERQIYANEAALLVFDIFY